MTIQGVGASPVIYQPTAAKDNKTTINETALKSVDGEIPISASTTVTLSDGRQSVVTEGDVSQLKSMSLTLAWAPQMFVQGDTSRDENLTLDEFSQQLQRVGVTADAAKQLFNSFDTSTNGELSVMEFVEGLTRNYNSGDQLFTNLLNSYTHDKSGNLDAAATDSFLLKGEALAIKYQQAAGIGRSAK